MRPWSRTALGALTVVGLAAVLLGVGAVANSSGGDPEVRDVQTSPVSSPTSAVEQLQKDLERVPGNYRAWTDLGLAYVQQARVTADPGLYARADGAFDKALELRPQDNDGALTGKATLAAARHDFAGALALTDRSLAINDFSATTYAVRADALTELGRYDQARDAIQKMFDLRPGGLDGYSRASYAFELRGDAVRAQEMLEQARSAARTPADKAFASYYLGEIAWHSGDLDRAETEYTTALADDPTYAFALAGRAKVLAARGETTAAAGSYQDVVGRLPLPEFVVAYGELLEATGQSAAAQEQYDTVRLIQKLFAANGQDVDTELALFEADHGTPQAAVASASKALAKRPDGIFTQDAYAWALHAAGRSAEALPYAKNAARLGYRNPSFAYHLGAIALAAGDKATAKTALTQVATLNQAFSPLHGPRAKALLAQLG